MVGERQAGPLKKSPSTARSDWQQHSFPSCRSLRILWLNGEAPPALTSFVCELLLVHKRRITALQDIPHFMNCCLCAQTGKLASGNRQTCFISLLVCLYISVSAGHCTVVQQRPLPCFSYIYFNFAVILWKLRNTRRSIECNLAWKHTFLNLKKKKRRKNIFDLSHTASAFKLLPFLTKLPT